MRRAPTLTLLAALGATLGAAAACAPDRPTAPASPAAPPRAEAEVVPLLATLVGRAIVDDPGDVGWHTSLASSLDGTQRVAYYDATNRRLKYAACSSNCTVAANWQRGVIDQSAEVGEYASLKVRSGVRHVVYYDAANSNLKYARCSQDCLVHGNWAKGVIASEGAAGRSASLAINAETGRLHVSYMHEVGSGTSILKYATCLSGCTSTSNWQRSVVDPGDLWPLSYTSIAVGPDGRRHITYGTGSVLKYATCAASCADPANWERVTADASPNVGTHSSLAIDASGVRHVSYYDGNYDDLRYARCASNCANSAGWARTRVDRGEGTSGTDVGRWSSLAVGADGRLHVSYYDQTLGRLKYASCGSSCLQATSWSRQYVDGGCTFLGCTNVGRYTSLKLGGGRVHISYYRFTGGDLGYAALVP